MRPSSSHDSLGRKRTRPVAQGGDPKPKRKRQWRQPIWPKTFQKGELANAGLPEPESVVPPATELNKFYGPQIAGVLIESWRNVRTYYHEGPLCQVYNIRFRKPFVDSEPIIRALEAVYNLQSSAFKINFSFGCLLYHTTDHYYRFFHPSDGVDQYLKEKVVLSGAGQLNRLRKALRDEADVVDAIMQRREDTKYVFIDLLTIRVRTYKMPDAQALIGGKRTRKSQTTSELERNMVKLPPQLMKMRSVLTLLRHPISQKPFRSSACFFRALVLFNHDFKCPPNFNRLVESYQRHYASMKGLKFPSKYDGRVTLDELPKLESVFKIRINVYNFDAENQRCFVKRLSPFAMKRTLSLEMTKAHFSLIKKLPTFASSFTCEFCGTYITTRRGDMTKHMSICGGDSGGLDSRGNNQVAKPRYCGNARWRCQSTILERLERWGVVIPTGARTSDLLTVWDAEAFGVEVGNDVGADVDENGVASDEPHDGPKLSYLDRQKLICVAINSTVPGFDNTVTMRIDETTMDERELVGRMLDYLLEIADTALEYELIRLQPVIDQVEKMIEHHRRRWEKRKSQYGEDDEKADGHYWSMTELDGMMRKLRSDAKKHVIFSFNGGSHTLSLSFFQTIVCSTN